MKKSIDEAQVSEKQTLQSISTSQEAVDGRESTSSTKLLKSKAKIYGL